MATVNAERSTLLDVVTRTEPGGGIAALVEQLQKQSVLLEDAHWIPGNMPTGHKFSSRTALPTVEWRKFNQGVTPSKSRAATVTESAGMLEGRSEVDVDLAKLHGNQAAYRMSEDTGFTQAMVHEVESMAFYGSTLTSPEKFQGLAPRMNATADLGGGQIIKVDASPSGSDQTSIWLVGWGENSVSMFYPTGFGKTGIESIDRGIQDVDDGTGKMFMAYVTVFKWHVGMMVKNWTKVARLCNIDTSAKDPTADTLVPKMIEAIDALGPMAGTRPVFYMNRTAKTLLHQQVRYSTKNSTLTTESPGGQPVTSFLGIPIRVTDAILNTEAVIS